MRFVPYLLRYGSALLVAWVFMLVVGVVHHDWIPALPPIGYNMAFLIVAVAFAVRSAVVGAYDLAVYIEKADVR